MQYAHTGKGMFGSSPNALLWSRCLDLSAGKKDSLLVGWGEGARVTFDLLGPRKKNVGMAAMVSFL